MTTGRRDRLVMLLAFVSGYTDGVGFLALGGAFTSVMTGNMVLLGLSAGSADGEGAGRAGGAILAFIAGAALGTQVAGTPTDGDPRWPAPVNRALALEALILVGAAVGWFVTGGDPGTAVTLVLLLAPRSRSASRAAPSAVRGLRPVHHVPDRDADARSCTWSPAVRCAARSGTGSSSSRWWPARPRRPACTSWCRSRCRSRSCWCWARCCWSRPG